MKKVFISQRLDSVGKFDEKRNNLDTRFLKLFDKLDIIPILIPNDIYLTKKIIKDIKPKGIILTSGGDALKKDVRYYSELLLINFAYKKNIPLIGICRGAQAINLYFSGKIKKISNHVRKKHKLNINLGNKQKVTTNCYHDYGIKKESLGKNLKVLGKTNDGSIELFKHKSKKIIGMMWHPERFKKLRAFELKIFKNLL